MELSEEEKKNLEFLNKLKFSCDNYYIVENGFSKDIDYILVRNALKALKDLIEKQQKEIERIKALDIYKILEDIELGNLVSKEKLQLKDKVIDEMAMHVEDYSADEICKKDCYADEYVNGHCLKCLNCIKQYFINKAKENKQL